MSQLKNVTYNSWREGSERAKVWEAQVVDGRWHESADAPAGHSDPSCRSRCAWAIRTEAVWARTWPCATAAGPKTPGRRRSPFRSPGLSLYESGDARTAAAFAVLPKRLATFPLIIL